VGERGEEHCRPTNRRGLTDVATPYVTFIADAALLQLSSRFTPPKWEKETISQFLRLFYYDAADRGPMLLSLSMFARYASFRELHLRFFIRNGSEGRRCPPLKIARILAISPTRRRAKHFFREMFLLIIRQRGS
jgi:hypothetical protein